ncbi:hypothetical protein D3C71_1904770 [compost metagenome]
MLAELAGEHAVHRVERHAQQHPQRDQGEQPGVSMQGRQEDAEQQRNRGRRQGHLIGAHASVMEVLYAGAQQVLEVWFELIDGQHRPEFPFSAHEWRIA